MVINLHSSALLVNQLSAYCTPTFFFGACLPLKRISRLNGHRRRANLEVGKSSGDGEEDAAAAARRGGGALEAVAVQRVPRQRGAQGGR